MAPLRETTAGHDNALVAAPLGRVLNLVLQLHMRVTKVSTVNDSAKHRAVQVYRYYMEKRF